MKIFELFQPLLEYSRDITLQKMAKQLQGISAATKLEPADVLEQIEAIDPTKNKQYVPWMVKQLAANQFRLEDRPRINKLLTDFLSIKNRLPQEQRDLGRMSLHQLDDIVDKAMNVELDTDKQQTSDTGTFPVVPGSKVLYNGPLGQLAIPETEEASCELGRGTKWCTTSIGSGKFDEYTGGGNGTLYIWRDKNGDKYQFHFETLQFKNDKSKPIDNAELQYFRTRHPVLSKLFAQEGDRLIKLGDADKLFSYAHYVIGGRWPDAETAILASPRAASRYAAHILRSRWPAAEATIKTDAASAVTYAWETLNSRWPEAEPIIAKDATSAVTYAEHVLGRRWRRAEKAIMRGAYTSGRYAAYVLHTRWPEAEPVIMSDPYTAFLYAKEVIGDRWPEAEPIIRSHKAWWKKYTKLFPEAGATPATNTAPKPKK